MSIATESLQDIGERYPRIGIFSLESTSVMPRQDDLSVINHRKKTSLPDRLSSSKCALWCAIDDAFLVSNYAFLFFFFPLLIAIPLFFFIVTILLLWHMVSKK